MIQNAKLEIGSLANRKELPIPDFYSLINLLSLRAILGLIELFGIDEAL